MKTERFSLIVKIIMAFQVLCGLLVAFSAAALIVYVIANPQEVGAWFGSLANGFKGANQ